jgi:predicted transcriptional regulator
MNKENRKGLINRYKQERAEAGIYRIVNQVNGRYLLEASRDIKGMKNRFAFSQKFGAYNALPGKLWEEIKLYGLSNFDFEILESMVIKQEMTDIEIEEELALMKEIWYERLEAEKAY